MGVLRERGNRGGDRLAVARWAAVMFGTLALFAAVAAVVTLRLREQVRQQIVHRDAEVLASVVVRLGNAAERSGEGFVDLEEAFDWLPVLLETSELRGVLGLRIYDPAGLFVASLPGGIAETDLDWDGLTALHALRPSAVYDRAADLGEAASGIPSGSRAPLVTVRLPLHRPEETRLLAAAEYLIDGRSVAGEFAELDRRLAGQAGAVFGVGAGLYLLIGGLVFVRLSKTRRLLAERSARLDRANRELTLAAKTSALGAVTGHLIHGLKNPLAALEAYFQSDETDADDRREAVAAVAKMNEQLGELLEFLREDGGESGYDLTLEEIIELVARKTGARGRTAGVEIVARVSGFAQLPGRAANIVMLVLLNLLDNALRATPPGKRVLLAAQTASESIQFTVTDEGGGLPAPVKARLFTPCASGTGGTGLGLALSAQLARQVNGTLTLERSDPTGTAFQLAIPRPAPGNPA